MAQLTMDKLVALCKGRGFIYPGSEIYGGLANTWDYGPLGVELKNNVKRAWWKKFVQENTLNTGIDCAILMNPNVWVASGHVGGFSDPLMDCRACKSRHRADNLIEDYMKKHHCEESIAGWDNAKMENYIREKQIPCPVCGKSDFTGVRQFNLMFKTFQGVTEDSVSTLYLRPETAQGIFVNFLNVQRTSRMKVPFGIAQVGKSFRNEITPGNFIFRVREFEQMELEFFCKPGTDLEWFAYWKEFCKNWLLGLGIKEENLKLRDHDPEELAFYSNATTDFEFKFPFGWGELWGVADRTDYDLKAHMKVSGKSLDYEEEETDSETRVVLKLHHALAPYKVAVLPLQKKALGEKSEEIYRTLCKEFSCTYDEAGSIGKRYRRQDEIGTPYCVTVDFETLDNGTVTVRERDSMAQIRLPIERLVDYFKENLAY